MFDKARAIGLQVNDWQDVITVNMLGQRFYDETGRPFTTNNYKSINPYVQGSYLNAKNIVWNPNNWLNAAMAGIGDGKNGGGPIWAIFDADACRAREMGARAAACRHRRRVLLQCRYGRRAREEDRDAIPARADAAGESGTDGGTLQHIRGFRASMRTSASPRRCTRSPRRRSMPPGRRRLCTTPVPACVSTRTAR